MHNNLFTNINTGAGTRPWQSGGDAGRGADSGTQRSDVKRHRDSASSAAPKRLLRTKQPTPFSRFQHFNGLQPPGPNLCCAAGSNSTWWNVYSPSRLLGLPMANKTMVDCSVGPLLNWIGLFNSRCAAIAALAACCSLRPCTAEPLGCPAQPGCCAVLCRQQGASLRAAAFCSVMLLGPTPPCRSVTNTTCAATRWTVDNIGAGMALHPPDLFKAMRTYWYLVSS